MRNIEFTEQPLGEGAHWRKFYDSRVLRWWHLPPKDTTVTIDSISELKASVGRESKQQLMARFKGAKLPFALNATNCMTLEQLYGGDPHDWNGKRVTLYVTQTEMAGKTVNCIRIRNKRPSGKEQDGAVNTDAPRQPEPSEQQAAPSEREPGQEG